MMKRAILIVAVALLIPLSSAAQAQTAQQKEASRNATREKLRQLLDTAGRGKDVNVTFQQSTKQPYNFVGSIGDGLKNAESLEIVAGVTADETISFVVYPHFNGGYINIDKVRNNAGLMRKLLNMNVHNFLYWGTDDSGDIFAAYTFTLESGFPSEAIVIVLSSIRNTDRFVGDLRTFIDGSAMP
jgi:opacity protein-like surface antigen